MSEIEMSMDERWVPLMESGRKRCTTRLRKKCQAGDTFTINGQRYVVTRVQAMNLRDASKQFYADEGFPSPAAMVASLRTYYPDLELISLVWCHHFIAIDGRD